MRLDPGTVRRENLVYQRAWYVDNEFKSPINSSASGPCVNKSILPHPGPHLHISSQTTFASLLARPAHSLYTVYTVYTVIRPSPRTPHCIVGHQATVSCYSIYKCFLVLELVCRACFEQFPIFCSYSFTLVPIANLHREKKMSKRLTVKTLIGPGTNISSPISNQNEWAQPSVSETRYV